MIYSGIVVSLFAVLILVFPQFLAIFIGTLILIIGVNMIVMGITLNRYKKKAKEFNLFGYSVKKK